jgi:hypothetical protein
MTVPVSEARSLRCGVYPHLLLMSPVQTPRSGRGHQKSPLPEAFRPRPMKNYSRFGVTQQRYATSAPLLPLINSSETLRTPTVARACYADRIMRAGTILASGQSDHQCSWHSLLAGIASRHQCYVIFRGIGARHYSSLVARTVREFTCAGGMTSVQAAGSRQAFVGLECGGSGFAWSLEGERGLRRLIGHI